MKKFSHLTVAVCLVVAVIALGAWAQEPVKKQKEFRAQLPIYYARVVEPGQRKQIYKIQEQHFQQVQPLLKKIRDLEKTRNAAIEAVLRSEQLEKVKEFIAAAKRRRDILRSLTPEQRKAADEAAKKAFDEVINKVKGKTKVPKSKK